MRMVTVVGARPQFIKASAVSHRIKSGFPQITEMIVHTGQHYDDNMSEAFFRELEIPAPAYNLEIGSGSHGQQTGAIMAGLETLMPELKPDVLLVYGDTNSTLAAALVAAKAGVTLAHVEAGLRSRRRAMAEEVNRVVTDRLSDLLFCPTQSAIDNLKAEGCSDAYLVGDVMLDAFRKTQSRAGSDALKKLGLTSKKYMLATVHRAENTDDPVRLSAILRALAAFSKTLPVVLPLHPRARARAGDRIDALPASVLIQPPLPYGDMVALLTHSAILATDSGGLQKEAVFAGVPCVTLRDETEWMETVAAGWNRLAGADEHAIAAALAGLLSSPRGAPPDYGDGDAAGKILSVIASRFA